MNKDGKKIVVQSPHFGGTFANIFVEYISRSRISVSQGRCTVSLKNWQSFQKLVVSIPPATLECGMEIFHNFY